MKRIFYLTILSALLLAPCLAQEKKETNYFQFTFSLKKDVLYIGDSTEIFAEITNISDVPEVIDTKRLFGAMRFLGASNQQKEDFSEVFLLSGNSGMVSHPPPDFNLHDFIILQPKETYKKNLEYKFNSSFFTKTQKYKMQLFYGQYEETKFKDIDVWNGTVESNEVNILIEKCKIK